MFSKEKINTGRQPELDIARGLAVLFMIIIHVQMYFASASVLDTYFADFNDWNGDIPAAPMFMFLLGIGINYTRKNEPALMMKRGLGLLLTAYLLNFVRGFVPCAIKAYCLMDISYLYQAFAELVQVDILQFSGLVMMLFALFFKFSFRKFAVVLTSIGFAALNLVLLPMQSETLALSALSGLFWGSNELTFFPFLTWMFYPIAGYLFGSLLIRCENKKRFYAASGVLAAIVFFGGGYLLGEVMGIPTGLASEMGYYHHIITDNIIFTGGVVLEIAVLGVVVRFIPQFFQNIAARWSRNTTTIFCIHWVLITWINLVIPSWSLEMPAFLALLIVVIFLSDFLSDQYAKWNAMGWLQKTPTAIPVLAATFIMSMVAISILPMFW